MNKQSREELKRKIDAIRIPHEWWTESISQAIPVVLYRAGDNEWAALVTQEIPKQAFPKDCDRYTFSTEQRARIAEFAGAANPAAILALLAEFDRLEAQRDRLLSACKHMREVFLDVDGAFGQWENDACRQADEAITEAESQS